MNGWVFLIIGLAVTIISSFIENFTIFIIVGIVFMFIGIVKIMTLTLGRKKEIEITQKQHVPGYIKCPNCAAYNFTHATRCHFCRRYL